MVINNHRMHTNAIPECTGYMDWLANCGLGGGRRGQLDDQYFALRRENDINYCK